MSMCSACGGLIMKPGKMYGWAGDVCHCHKPWEQPKDGETWEQILELKRRLADLEDKEKSRGSL